MNEDIRISPKNVIDVFRQLGYIEGASVDSKQYGDILEAVSVIENVFKFKN